MNLIPLVVALTLPLVGSNLLSIGFALPLDWDLSTIKLTSLYHELVSMYNKTGLTISLEWRHSTAYRNRASKVSSLLNRVRHLHDICPIVVKFCARLVRDHVNALQQVACSLRFIEPFIDVFGNFCTFRLKINLTNSRPYNNKIVLILVIKTRWYNGYFTWFQDCSMKLRSGECMCSKPPYSKKTSIILTGFGRLLSTFKSNSLLSWIC